MRKASVLRHSRVVFVFYHRTQTATPKRPKKGAPPGAADPVMTPLFARFPVCLTFVAIGIVGLIVVALGMYNRTPLEDPEPADGPSRYGVTGPPPWWVLPLMLLAVTVVMLVLAWYWPE